MPEIVPAQSAFRSTRRSPFARAATAGALAAVLSAIAPFALAQVSVSEPWVRGTVPPQKATGAFMKLASKTDAALVAAASPAARQVEIHEMAMVNNVMRMRPIPELALPAGKVVELKPGGYHVMLMGLDHQLKKGDVVPITLTIRGTDGKTQTVEVKADVRELSTHKQPMEPGRH